MKETFSLSAALFKVKCCCTQVYIFKWLPESLKHHLRITLCCLSWWGTFLWCRWASAVHRVYLTVNEALHVVCLWSSVCCEVWDSFPSLLLTEDVFTSCSAPLTTKVPFFWARSTEKATEEKRLFFPKDKPLTEPKDEEKYLCLYLLLQCRCAWMRLHKLFSSSSTKSISFEWNYRM